MEDLFDRREIPKPPTAIYGVQRHPKQTGNLPVSPNELPHDFQYTRKSITPPSPSSVYAGLPKSDLTNSLGSSMTTVSPDPVRTTGVPDLCSTAINLDEKAAGLPSNKVNINRTIGFML
mmetsp:Transcript_34381/g.41544  ORF Transcript_34381/g.41544 Transcript_34381/m.41544 type:complete len:119 (+) Transcript_34381:117-473(+)|eukprot:CAMPEP_0197848210 /NCGR_PEP_ID=MMETSP1438-20131217/7985_1 /TAXON_ID=1461541 /ORGANISM="Pterosperma sp., Strain CCMP1384" /LENGTH=118 /DNA_ID=CAMNT_0043460353 /DNA_START=107 /DNA_END=463 /DNA_ORIENTATION=-